MIEAIDLEDPETLALFAAGDTKGIFQFEQAGAIRLLRRVRPNHFEEVVATTSLNRPGASDYIDNFVKRKHGQEKVDILDPAIEEILRPTYGIMLYQEQVMQVAQRFAGFSLGKADILRRAMGKKNAAEMHQMEDDLSQVLLNLDIRKKKPKRSLRSWKNSQVMGLTVPMPMPILPWPFRWPISRSIIQMFSLMSCSITRAAII